MMTGTAATAATATTAEPTQLISLDDLKARTLEELEALYHQLPEPDGIQALDGKPKGEMLAVTALDWKPVKNVLRLFGDSPVFPWLGKGFASRSAGWGEGNNRLNLLGYKPEIFSFNTRLEESVLDDRSCVLLDYDLPENPLPIRHIRDELREAAPGLWFGPAMARVGGNHYPILWFAVDFNQ